MLKVEIELDKLQELINNAVDSAIERHGIKNNLPTILNRAQFMELLDIGQTKAAELLNREDFPVIRELGHPRILTHLFIKWCEEHSGWVDAHAGDTRFTRQVRGAS